MSEVLSPQINGYKSISKDGIKYDQHISEITIDSDNYNKLRDFITTSLETGLDSDCDSENLIRLNQAHKFDIIGIDEKESP